MGRITAVTQGGGPWVRPAGLRRPTCRALPPWLFSVHSCGGQTLWVRACQGEKILSTFLFWFLKMVNPMVEITSFHFWTILEIPQKYRKLGRGRGVSCLKLGGGIVLEACVTYLPDWECGLRWRQLTSTLVTWGVSVDSPIWTGHFWEDVTAVAIYSVSSRASRGGLCPLPLCSSGAGSLGT